MAWVGDRLTSMKLCAAGITVATERTPKLKAAPETDPNVRQVKCAVKIELLPSERERDD